MKISELKSGQSKVDIEATVTEIGETREFDRFGRTIKVATAKIKDDSGSMNLSLWNDDVGRVKKGDKIKVTNGYVNEFQGELQLTSGKFGKLEVIGEGTEEPEEKEEAKAEEKIEEEKVESEEESYL